MNRTVPHYFSLPAFSRLTFPAPANKKRSNRAQNDYEMVDSIASEQSMSTMPSSRDNKDAIISIPEDQNVNEQLPTTKVLPQVEPEEEKNLPHLENGEHFLDI